MEYVVGLLLAATVVLSASRIGLDRDRAFYPTVLMVIASYYALFAVMAGSFRALALEATPIAIFVGLAIVGFKRSPWFLVAGLLAHAAFDFTHSNIIENAGVPSWWPGFCSTVDATVGAHLRIVVANCEIPSVLSDTRRHCASA